jgi:hypothetical protein
VAQIVDDIDRRLREARPAPPPAFVDQLERRLLPAPRPRRRPVIVAGALAAAALALVIAILSLAGALPGPLNRDEPVRATERCRTVMEPTVVRRPRFVVGRDGELRVIYRRVVEQRPQRRCR